MIIETPIGDGYTFQAYHPSDLSQPDLDQISNLYLDSFGDKLDSNPIINAVASGDMNPYIWRNMQSPNSEESYIGVVRYENEIVAHSSFITHKAVYNGENVKAVHELDSMVHSQHRRKSLYKYLRQNLFEIADSQRVSIYYGFPNNINPLSKPEHSDAYNIQILNSIPFYENQNLFLDQNISVVLRDITEIPFEVNELWSKMISKTGFSIIRDQDFLNWRYLKNPINKDDYTVLVLEGEKGEIDGLVVVKKYYSLGSQIPKGHIVDILSPDSQTTQNLVNGAEHFLKQAGCTTNSMFLYPNLPGYYVLKTKYDKKIDAFTLVMTGLDRSISPDLELLLHAGDIDVF